MCIFFCFFFFSSRRRHTRCSRDWSSDVCSSDLFGLLCLPQSEHDWGRERLVAVYRVRKSYCILRNIVLGCPRVPTQFQRLAVADDHTQTRASVRGIIEVRACLNPYRRHFCEHVGDPHRRFSPMPFWLCGQTAKPVQGAAPMLTRREMIKLGVMSAPALWYSRSTRANIWSDASDMVLSPQFAPFQVDLVIPHMVTSSSNPFTVNEMMQQTMAELNARGGSMSTAFEEYLRQNAD